jgi:LacI family transcriptional regulator
MAGKPARRAVSSGRLQNCRMSRYCFCAEGAKCHRQHFTKAATIALLLLTLPIANVMTRKSTKAATIKDIAQIAGVTNITVSRVFTAPDKVKPETRERILAAARTLNYVPNAFARNIKASQSPIIGVVTDDTFNIVYSHIIKEVCRLSDAKGYSVMFFTTNGNRQIEARALQTLVSYKAAGIILSVVEDSDRYDKSHIDVVRHSSSQLIQLDRQFDTLLPAVYINNSRAGELVAEAIMKKAFRNVLVIGGSEHSHITRQRIDGIRSGIDERVTLHTLYTDYRYEHAKAMIQSWFSTTHERYDAIVGLNGMITLAAINLANKWGMHDTGFISVDEVPCAEDFNQVIPYVAHDTGQWARVVSENIISAIEGRPYETRVMLNGFLKNL